MVQLNIYPLGDLAGTHEDTRVYTRVYMFFALTALAMIKDTYKFIRKWDIYIIFKYIYIISHFVK